MMTECEKFISVVDNDILKPSDAIILLEGDGLNRYQKAVELYKQNIAAKIVFSGNITDYAYGSFPFSDILPHVLNAGVPTSAVIHEDRSLNTKEQAVEVVRMAIKNSWKRLVLIASHEHQYRAYLTFLREVLDKKTPLLRSMDALSKQALRILRLFGNTEATRVLTTVGPEQEYFLIDQDMFDAREDLVMTGRTLFGARSPKGQELEDHYFGAIKPRVKAFMKDLNDELWKLGVLAKTEHNEVAPAQHELAPIFTTSNIASDHNQLTMEIMKKVAHKHGMACLLHEKPFDGVNGSGKHNNWSISTDLGENLLEPGSTPSQNAQFLLFLSAVIKAVDEYADLLRVSVASAGNDHRLGANEAPPAIISMFIGDELAELLDALEAGADYNEKSKHKMNVGVDALPDFVQDTTDRNRTSPFAFTGNKFEFRMLGSSLNIACPNLMLNTMVAEELAEFADQLENKDALSLDGVVNQMAVSSPGEKTMNQLSIFDTMGNDQTDDILFELRDIDLSRVTPMDAMNLVYKWQKSLQERW